MSKVLVTEQHLSDIGDAIRDRLGVSTTYKPSQMAAAIETIAPEFSASDEGKVVSSGALVAQTSTTVTENGTYDTTLNNEVVVNVSEGDGGLFDFIGFEQGAVQGYSVSSRGTYVNVKVDSSTRIRSTVLIPLKLGKSYNVQVAEGFMVAVQPFGYSNSEIMSSPSGSSGYNRWLQSATLTNTSQTSVGYIAISIKKPDDSDITPAEFPNASLSLAEVS